VEKNHRRSKEKGLLLLTRSVVDSLGVEALTADILTGLQLSYSARETHQDVQ